MNAIEKQRKVDLVKTTLQRVNQSSHNSKNNLSYKVFLEYLYVNQVFFTNNVDEVLKADTHYTYIRPSSIDKEIKRLRALPKQTRIRAFGATLKAIALPLALLTAAGLCITAMVTGFAVPVVIGSISATLTLGGPSVLWGGLATLSVIYGTSEICKQTMNTLTQHKFKSSFVRLLSGLTLGGTLAAVGLALPAVAATVATGFITGPVILGAAGCFAGIWVCKLTQRVLRKRSTQRSSQGRTTNPEKNTLSEQEQESIIDEAYALKSKHSQHIGNKDDERAKIKNHISIIMRTLNERMIKLRPFKFFNPRSALAYVFLTSRQRQLRTAYKNMIATIKDRGFRHLVAVANDLLELEKQAILLKHKQFNMAGNELNAEQTPLLLEETSTTSQAHYQQLQHAVDELRRIVKPKSQSANRERSDATDSRRPLRSRRHSWAPAAVAGASVTAAITTAHGLHMPHLTTFVPGLFAAGVAWLSTNRSRQQSNNSRNESTKAPLKRHNTFFEPRTNKEEDSKPLLSNYSDLTIISNGSPKKHSDDDTMKPQNDENTPGNNK